MIIAKFQDINIVKQRKLKGDKNMEDLIIDAGTAIIGFVAGVGTIVIATIKKWWFEKTPEAKKRLLKMSAKAFADGELTKEEYDAIIDEI